MKRFSLLRPVKKIIWLPVGIIWLSSNLALSDVKDFGQVSTLIDNGQYQEAIEWLDNKRAQYPSDANITRYKAFVWYLMVQYEKALEDVENSLVHSFSKDLVYEKSNVLYALGEC